MNDLENIISDVCGFFPTDFLFFSANVFEPIIYYSHLTSFFATFFLGLVILLKGTPSMARHALLGVCFSICLWTISNLALWANADIGTLFFFWNMTVLAEPLLYAFSILLIEAIATTKITVKKILLIFSPIVPVFLLLPTRLSLIAYDGNNCEREIFEGPLVDYYFFVIAAYLLWIIGRTIFAKKNGHLALVGIATSLMLAVFSFWNNYGSLTGDYSFEGYNLFGVPVFIAILAYTIVKFRTFEIKVFGTQALALGVWFLVFSLLFVGDIAVRKIIIAATLTATGVAGYYLVKSVSREVVLRERAEALSKNLEIANLRLLELDKQKTEFVSLASHQLRGPLTAIKGYASMMNEGDYGDLPVSAMEILGRIQRSAHDMAVLITDYLDVTRIELGKVKYAPERFSMRDLLSEVEKELLPNTPKGITLAIEEGADPRFIYADRNKIKQVVMNLIDNAVKYTPRGEVRATLTRNEGYARLEVKDSGVGINKSSLPHLFQKFSRAQNASKSNIKGTGLGLYIAKTIADHHRGRISAASEGEGKGSTFTFELPLADEQAPSAKVA